ncbi:MAG: hypothetical protein JSU65_01370 [Candidatus Zixiibacteriota bacterium]|nr:MAG: hypothetical protein JSU65_01370 [candidate division Zixibacteria bacterium]
MKMLGCAHVLPSKKVTNEELLDEIIRSNRNNLSADQSEALGKMITEMFRKSGTRIRYHRSDRERAADLTTQAGRELLEKTGARSADVDLLIYAGVGRGCLEPASANIFQNSLRLKNATAFDVLDACAGWIRSVAIAHSLITQGTYNTVMILNSEFNFREYANFELTNIDEIRYLYSAFTIGEAATATLLTRSDNGNNFYFSFKNWGAQHDLCMIPLPNISQYTKPRLENGHAALKFYADSDRLVRFTLKKLIAHYRNDPVLNRDHYDIVFGHAASEASNTYWMKCARINEQRLFRTHEGYGNTVSASIPLAISLSTKENQLARGMKVLTVVGSAGVVTAFASFEY